MHSFPVRFMRIFLAGLLFITLKGGPAMGQDCYTSSMVSPTPFMGNDGEIFKLTDGSIWEVKYEYEYLYEYNPNVIICPSRGILVVRDKKLNVVRLGSIKPAPTIPPSKITPPSSVIESQIDGDFEGWEGETIVKLMNGQIWQQSEYYYHYYYSFMPPCIIFPTASGYKMKVEGVENAVGVTRLK